MNAAECNLRANQCAANAALALNELVSLEYLKLAAQWRAMATRVIFIDVVGALTDPAGRGNPLALPEPDRAQTGAAGNTIWSPPSARV